MRDQKQLRPYQHLISDFAIQKPRCAIWADMGLGKTASTLTAANALMAVDDSPVLVLAPLRVANSTWPDEVKEWKHLSHLRVVPITGNEKERRHALSTKGDVYTTNYENLVWLVEQVGERWPWRTVIADEATKLKSFRLRQGGKRAQAFAQVAHSKVERLVELTGTPAPNGLQDLWGQMWFLDAGKRLGRTYSAFMERWFQQGYDHSTSPLAHAQAEIQSLLSDICLTVSAKDWFDLEAPIVNNIKVQLPPRSRVLYKDMERELFMRLDCGSEVEALTAAAKTQKLLQLASGAVYLDPEADNDAHPRAKDWREVHDQKIQVLDEIVEEANGAPVLVAYHFRSDLERLLRAFPRGRALDKDPHTIKDWNEGRIPVLFAHPASAGHGLSLQHGGNILVYFSHDWNLENRLQILERIGPVRQKQSGYDRPVHVHNIIAADTIDELVLARVETKRSVQDILLEAMKQKGYRV